MNASESADQLLSKLLTATKQLTEAEARVLAKLLVHPMIRPRDELVQYLQRFSDLEAPYLAANLDSLISRGYIVAAPVRMRTDYFTANPEVGLALYPSDTDAAAAISETIARARAGRPNWSLRLLGPIEGDGDQFETWAESIEHSTREVIIWVLSTAYPRILAAARVAAKRGVKIRVLVGGQIGVQRIRGAFEARRASLAASEWARLALEYKCVLVRTTNRQIDLEPSGSSLVDGQLLRMTIYDPMRERGSQGQLFELSSLQPRQSINLVRIYTDNFETAWRNATSARASGPHSLTVKLRIYRLAPWRPVGTWLMAAFSLVIVLFAIRASIQTGDEEPPWFDLVKNIDYMFIVASLTLALSGAAVIIRDRKASKRWERREQ